MGGVCSRKRDQQVVEDGMRRGVSGRYGKSNSSKWLVTSFSRPMVVHQPGLTICPSLMELCIDKICEDIDQYSSFSMLPKDISQQIFNKLVLSHLLTDVSLQKFRDCALEDVWLGEYPGVQDSWMDVISSQRTSLLSVDLSGSDVTDTGLGLLKEAEFIVLFSDSTDIDTNFARADDCFMLFLVNLEKLDLERCSGIHGGFVHIKGLSKLESLNIRCCKCITDLDLKAISGLNNLKELQISNSNITDFGLSYLGVWKQSVKRCSLAFSMAGLRKLIVLNLEGCYVTAACLDSISALVALAYLNLSRCCLTDDGCDKFSGLTNLESLNLDSCKIGNEGLANLTGLSLLKSLELSDTEVGSNGLRHLSGLTRLETLNLSFTLVTDSGLKRLSGLTALKSLNLDARQITDAGLSALTSLTGLMHLDLFGARISDIGTNYLRCLRNLQSLEICGGGLTDAGVKNIKDLASLTILNLSQNCSLTNKSLELISGLTALVSLNVSNSHITNDGLPYLKPLKNLRSLSLESCKVTASEIKKLQSTALPNLISFRPE
ncbi:Leucine-rich repeat - like 10 [Theobroma cacao]|nr:Leucine-rich repeat - like 10 [Theobroma cacao]